MHRAVGLWGLLLLGGCGSSFEPDYYTLMSVPGTVTTGIVYTVKIERPTIPAYLDRPDMVRQGENERVQIDDMKNWAEPLDRMVERVLAEDMRQRLPSSVIVTEADDVPLTARFIIETDIQKFNVIHGDEATVRGQILIKDKQHSPQPAAYPIELMTPSGHSAAANVSALSDLVGRTADQIILRLGETAKITQSLQ